MNLSNNIPHHISTNVELGDNMTMSELQHKNVARKPPVKATQLKSSLISDANSVHPLKETVYSYFD